MTSFFFVLIMIVAFASWLMTIGSRWLAHRCKAIDRPTGGRKIHTKPMPLLGGLGIGLVIFVCFSLLVQNRQMIGFLIGLVILLVVGVLDDRFDLSPFVRFPLYALACLIVMLTGTTIHQVTRFAGYGGVSLGWLEFPITFIWLFGVTLTMKVLDGLDGLVAGQTVIGAGLIAALALSPAYFQPLVAVLAMIVAGAYLGFLPVNLNPAKQFLGESGGTIAGFSLAFLAIVSGTKVATALMAVGLPLADISVVVIGRIFRGASPFRGDDTHLHYKLMKAGLSQRMVVGIMWSIALLFGLAALGLQTRGKILLLIALVGLTVLLSLFTSMMRRSRIPKV